MGKHKKLNSPSEFLALWDEYKKSIDDNPDQLQKATNKGVQTEEVQKPYLRQGFEAYVFRTRGFHVHQYIDNYNNAYEEYLGVVTCARKEWEENQISGTLTGKYKAPNLTARLNGLTEKQETTHKGEAVKDITVTIIPPKESGD
jgi:hypothetical protein